MKTRLLGISGKKGSGKSTLAFLLAKELEDVDIRPLAEPLKALCRDLLGVPAHLLTGDEAAKNTPTTIRQRDMPHWGPMQYRRMVDHMLGYDPGDRFLTVREVMQQVGTEVVRKMKPTAWIDSLLRARDLSTAGWMMVDDVRFPDEADAIRGAGGRVVRLARGAGRGGTHASETALDDYPHFDLVVPEDCTPVMALANVMEGLAHWWPEGEGV